MKNRVCVITGATSGVGRATALGVAKLGATVVLPGRNEVNGARAAEEIIASTGNRNVVSRVVDLSDFDSVRAFAAGFRDEFKELHVLSNNAAILPMERQVTQEGIEKIFAVNYLSHFLLTNLLLDLLRSCAPARVITVSGTPSLLQKGRLDLDDLFLERDFTPLKATYRAAVAKVMFSYELAKRLENSGVTSNTFHPGLVKSKLTRDLPALLKFFADIGHLFFRKDCSTCVYLASSPEVEKVSGQFFKNKRAVKFTPREDFAETAAKLWEKSELLVNLR